LVLCGIRWRLLDGEKIIADSGDGFGKRSGAVASIERTNRHAPAAEQG